MLKVGVLRGREDSFPEAVIAEINRRNCGVEAEFIHLGGTSCGEVCPYSVILDRISHEVPYYEVYLKQASMQGTYIVNNPFWMHVDDKFFGYALAQKLGIPVPKTVVLPNREYIADINAGSLRNLWPIDWEARLAEVGLPCIMKPAFGGGWKNVYKIHSVEEAVRAYDESGSLTMTLQEFIKWDDYIRCLSVGRKYFRAIRYIPRPMGQGEYVQDQGVLDPADLAKAEEYARIFNQAIGYDMNALEFAVKDHVLYAIDITNYVCDFDYRSLKDAHFPWVVNHMADFIIEKAKENAHNDPTACWDKFIKR
ncbi:hypothetical protein IJT93_10180 [bacterium]|nr:hypothetical protein [bacterium]